MPALSLYCGIVLSLESSPHSSAIRLKLHPSCRPPAKEEVAAEEAYDEMEGEAEQEARYPKYFGEDLDTPAGDEEHPDIKIINLDDIVDCRKITLS